jgi:hypothetical protein
LIDCLLSRTAHLLNEGVTVSTVHWIPRDHVYSHPRAAG